MVGVCRTVGPIGIALAIAVLATTAGPASAQSQSDPHAAYRQLLLRYRQGEQEAVVREISSWDEKRLIALRSTSALNPPGAGFGDLGDRAADLETAVALHTRVAVTRAEALTAQSPHAHLDFARRLVDRLATSQHSSAFVRRWYVALSYYLGAASPSLFLAHAATTERLYRSDAEVLVSLGIGFERVAEARDRPSIQSTVFRATASAAPEDGQSAVSEQMERLRWFDVAVSCYRRAISNAEHLVVARLRLGLVLVLTQRYQAAVAELDVVEHQATTDADKFLAALLSGLALDQLHKEEPALAAYRKARAIAPNARSAVFALSELEGRRGNSEEARVILNGLVARSPRPRLDDDPYWRLRNDWRSVVDRALDSLDAAVTQ